MQAFWKGFKDFFKLYLLLTIPAGRAQDFAVWFSEQIYTSAIALVSLNMFSVVIKAKFQMMLICWDNLGAEKPFLALLSFDFRINSNFSFKRTKNCNYKSYKSNVTKAAEFSDFSKCCLEWLNQSFDILDFQPANCQWKI